MRPGQQSPARTRPLWQQRQPPLRLRCHRQHLLEGLGGNLLARYKAYVNSGQTYLALEELALYGSDRLGLLTENQLLYQEPLGQYGGGTV